MQSADVGLQARVSAPQWALFHNTEFWTLPEEYHPERFLGDPKFANDKLDALQPFSTGPRNCVGKKYVPS